jgi:hypothetical protein
MANKMTSVVSSSSAVVSTPAPINNPGVLTVVVLNSNNQPVTGAQVSISPSDASAVTNAAGEAQFTLGSATKYSVTASADNKTVTVPYYVTANGATRLVVNPVYVQSVEAKLHPAPWYDSPFAIAGGVVLVIVILFVIWQFFFRGRK